MLKIYELWKEASERSEQTSDPYYFGKKSAFYECLDILRDKEKFTQEEMLKFQIGFAYKPKEKE